MRGEAKKSNLLNQEIMVQHEKKVTEIPVVKRIQIQLKKSPKYPKFFEVSEVSEVSENNDEKHEPVKKAKPTDS